ncbi:hypothetical protein, partial [Endothiovibrio diazotrophicus]
AGRRWGRRLVLVVSGLLAAASSLAAIDPDHLPALWLARPGDTLKLDAANGDPQLAIAESGAPGALAVDPVRSRLWSYRDGQLAAYGFDGDRLLGRAV